MIDMTRDQASWLVTMSSQATAIAIEKALDGVDAEVADRVRRSLEEDVPVRLSDVFAKTSSPEVALQRIEHIEGGVVIGYEALARFGGGIGPADHFREAAEYGLEVDLELATLRAALLRLDELPYGTFMGVNVSSTALVDPRFGEVLATVDMSRLVIELTQQSMISDVQELRRRFNHFQEIGAVFAVDAAGYGFFHSERLLELKPEMIKIDRTFVSSCDTDEAKRGELVSLIKVGRRIGAFVVATGVETQEERELLASLGVDAVQGYFIGKPSVELLDEPQLAASAY